MSAMALTVSSSYRLGSPAGAARARFSVPVAGPVRAISHRFITMLRLRSKGARLHSPSQVGVRMRCSAGSAACERCDSCHAVQQATKGRARPRSKAGPGSTASPKSRAWHFHSHSHSHNHSHSHQSRSSLHSIWSDGDERCHWHTGWNCALLAGKAFEPLSVMSL